jgi:hypothetical protein
MILGMTTLTFVHVVLSLIGILSGFVVVFGLLTSRRMDGWTATFLSTTIAASATGFLFFPFHKFLPSHAVGILSLMVLALATFGRYARHLAGAWNSIYAIGAVFALYLNVFVLIVQLFLKVSVLKRSPPRKPKCRLSWSSLRFCCSSSRSVFSRRSGSDTNSFARLDRLTTTAWTLCSFAWHPLLQRDRAVRSLSRSKIAPPITCVLSGKRWSARDPLPPFRDGA